MTTANNELFRAFVLFLLRRRSPFSYIVRAGALIIAAAVSLGFVINIAVPWTGGVLRLGFNTGDGLPLALIISVIILARL